MALLSIKVGQRTKENIIIESGAWGLQVSLTHLGR